MINRSKHGIEDNFNLEKEFTKLGFDYKSMLNTARYVNDWTILLTTESVFRFRMNNADRIYFVFTVIQLGTKQDYHIYHIQATLLTSLPNSNRTKIIVTKDYWNYNEPFPTKEMICDDISIILKADSGRKSRWAFENHLCKFLMRDHLTDESELN